MSDERDREASPEETRAAEALRRALEGEPSKGEAADLARLAGRLQATMGVAARLEPSARKAAVEAALARATRRRWTRWTVALIAAAVAALVLGGLLVPLATRTRPGEPPAEAYAAPTDPVFEGPFSEDQSPAERVDMILAARTRGYFAGLAAGR